MNEIGKFKTVLLHGAREFPPAELLLNRLLRKRPHDRVDATVWEDQYSSGHWDFLDGLSESSRYAIVADWREKLKPGGSILEIGCGAGQLLRVMRRGGYERYLGVDISQNAIAAAKAALGDAQTHFIAGDAATMELEGQFDVIIINEALNYFVGPGEFVRRLHAHLLPGGVLIISMAQCDLRDGLSKLAIWRAIAPDHEVLEEVSLHRQPWPIWIIKALRPKG